MSLSDPVLTAIAVGSFASLGGFALHRVGSRRKASDALTNKPADLWRFATPAPKAEVIHTVLQFAQTSGLKVESVDEIQGRIVVSADMNLTSNHNGYWLPVYISENGSGMTEVEIGIKSKTFQFGFMLRFIRNKAANRIQTDLLTQGNRRSP